MGFSPNEVRAMSLVDFTRAAAGFAQAQGAPERMSEAEAMALRSEIFDD